MTNWLYTGDNIKFLNRLDSESVDLIYLDPPFNSKRNYVAPIGEKKVQFKDIWTWSDVDEELLASLIDKYPDLVGYISNIAGLHSKAMRAYILFMTQRIFEMHRVLKPTGSLYLHCDPTASHYLKIVLDKIFKSRNFRNEIIWQYRTGGIGKNHFARKHDVLLFYTKSEKYFFDLPKEKSRDEKRFNQTDEEGRKFYEKAGNRYYLDEGVAVADVWDIYPVRNVSKERLDYPTQKPLALLHRIIEASSKEGDLVLDPFCGCATTCAAAQQLKRKWIGIDVEPNAPTILMERLSDDAGMFKDFSHTELLPARTDLKIEKKSLPIKQALFAKQNSKCNGCQNEMRIENLEIDHIIPKSKGGSDAVENYQLLCGNCNRIKGNRPMEYLRMKIKQREKLLLEQITFGT